MKRVSWMAAVVLLLAAGVARAENNLADKLQAISVTIRAGSSEGSGVTVCRDDKTFIWTAGHVVDGLRRTRKVVDPKTGTDRTIVEFQDAAVVRILVENGRRVGRVEMDAEVIRYSDADHGEDLALLLVHKQGFIKDSAIFYLNDELVPLGTRLYHVGSLLGSTGSNSMTAGIVSQHGRMVGKKEFLQSTATAFPGSSGGGIYLAESGQYVGMLVRGAGEGFNLCIPVQRIRAWAKKANVEWAMDPKVKMPTDDELEKLPIEDIGFSWGGAKSDTKQNNFLIFKRPE